MIEQGSIMDLYMTSGALYLPDVCNVPVKLNHDRTGIYNGFVYDLLRFVLPGVFNMPVQLNYDRTEIIEYGPQLCYFSSIGSKPKPLHILTIYIRKHPASCYTPNSKSSTHLKTKFL